MRYFQHGETGRVTAREDEPQGDWYEIEKDQYEDSLHPLSRPTPHAVDECQDGHDWHKETDGEVTKIVCVRCGTRH